MRKELGKNPTQLGRSIVKARALNKYEARRDGRQRTAHYHNTDDHDDEEAKKLHSVMERNDLDEFLNMAMMKEQDFSAQKANVVIVGGATVLQMNKKEIKEELEYEHVRIPRRPDWDFGMSADELQRRERESFLAWRRDLAQYEEASVDKCATPFEKNIEVWKQLWRVAERSHVIAQVVDARNPLLYYCRDLFTLSQEMDERKACVLVINKADFLPRQAREYWGRYFDSQNINYIFWSAKEEAELQEEKEAARIAREEERLLRRAARRAAKKASIIKEIKDMNAKRKKELIEAGLLKVDRKPNVGSNMFANLDDEEEEEQVEIPESDNIAYDDDDMDDEDYEVDENLLIEAENEGEEEDEHEDEVEHIDMATRDPYDIVGHHGLLEFFKSFADPTYVTETYHDMLQHKADVARQNEERGRPKQHNDNTKDDGEKIVIGMLGFPNVGKSSTINALMGAKKVSVSSTAGHTKHFQTLNLGDGLVLCDCPGLVFPTFVHSRASLVINGVIPIDTLRDFLSPVEDICTKISRSQVVQVYGLDIPAWKQMDAMTLLTSYARLRGFYKNAGRPDETRSARIILKDYVAGKLLYCQAPPHLTREEKTLFYESFTEQEELFARENPENRNIRGDGDEIKYIPHNGKSVSSDPLNFEKETEYISAGLDAHDVDRGYDNGRDVINVKVNRKKVITIHPEVEKLSVYETRKSRGQQLEDLDSSQMTKKQMYRMRNKMKKGKNIIEGDIVKKGAAGSNSEKYFGKVFVDGKRVKQ